MKQRIRLDSLLRRCELRWSIFIKKKVDFKNNKTKTVVQMLINVLQNAFIYYVNLIVKFNIH